MSHDHHHHQAGAGSDLPHFSAEHWDERYSGDQLWSGEPNRALVVEADGLTPGRALDVGCGEGADAIWLARQGWEVTALDISRAAVQHALDAAAQAGVKITGCPFSLQEADLKPGEFDLVSAMYPVLERTPEQSAERKLMSLVAPGGTLLFVHHADVDREHALANGFDPDEYVSPAGILAALDDDWQVIVDERRERQVVGGAGAGHSHDLIVRATRTR